MARVFVAIDLETTGVRVSSASQPPRVVAVAAVDLETRAHFHALVNPEERIPGEATALHGVTDAQAEADGQPWAVAGRRFFAWMLGRVPLGGTLVLCGHNVRDFDLRVLSAESARCGVPFLSKAGLRLETLDSLHAARALWPGAPNTLGDVHRRLFSTSPQEAHTALGDAAAAARIAVVLRRWKIEPLPFLSAL